MKEYTCRVAIVGAHRPRVAKVLSLLQSPDQSVVQPSEHVAIKIEYLPCIASFGVYKDETGAIVKYLSTVSYHGPDGKQDKPSSLAPFFDEERDDKDPFAGVAAVAIGCGIDDDPDIQQIATFLQALTGVNYARILVDSVKPNSEFASMKEEMIAYQALDAAKKEEVSTQQSIGPGKMAKLVESLAFKAIERAYPKPIELVQEAHQETLDDITVEVDEPLTSRIFDQNKIRYACRICRSFLFDEHDIEDPPHQPYKHNFGYRKQGSNKCESIFLSSGLDWMGDLSAVEGRFGCPSCATKLGVWKWAGTQCSCGTWVVPAIQVPSSKVDIVFPVAQESLLVVDPVLVNPCTNVSVAGYGETFQN